jgi:hypothetical protein
MEYNPANTASEAYGFLVSKISEWHPVTYTDTSINLTYEAATVIFGLTLLAWITLWYQRRQARKRLNEAICLKGARSRWLVHLTDLYRQIGDDAVKAKLTARNKRRLQNGGAVKFPDLTPKRKHLPEPKNSLETLWRAVSPSRENVVN